MDEQEYWRLCDELTVVQAALLVVGEFSPEAHAYVESWEAQNHPVGYGPAKSAIVTALKRGKIRGNIVPVYDRDINGNIIDAIADSVDAKESTVETFSLTIWLEDRGFKKGFFFPSSSKAPDYLNPNNAHYAPKLAAAVRAWQAVQADSKYLNNGKSIKQNLESWLTAHAAEFDLVKDDGEINADAIKNQISKVANWQDKGGAPTTPGV